MLDTGNPDVFPPSRNVDGQHCMDTEFEAKNIGDDIGAAPLDVAMEPRCVETAMGRLSHSGNGAAATRAGCVKAAAAVIGDVQIPGRSC